MRFDLLSLKLFVTVCEQQSISRTAEMERIAASAVSKRISDLEAAVKTPLFLRNQKGLGLTPAAHDLLRHARIVLRDLGQLENEMLDHSKGRRGDVRLFSCHSQIIQHLPSDLARFLALHPAIHVSIDEAFSRTVVQAVSEHAADLGIFGGDVTAASLHVTPYRTDRLVVMMPVGHPLASAEAVSFADIVGHDIVGSQVGSCLDQLMSRAAAALGLAFEPRVRVNGFDPSASLVEAGLGLALVSDEYAFRRAAAGPVALVALDEPWAVRQWNLCSRDPKSLAAPVKLLLDHLSARPSSRENVRLVAMPGRGARAVASRAPADLLVAAR